MVSLILSSSTQQASGRADDVVAAVDWGNLSEEEKKEAEDLLAKCYGYPYTTNGNYYYTNPYSSSAYTSYPATGDLYSTGYGTGYGYGYPDVSTGYTFG